MRPMKLAPEWDISEWLNTDAPLKLEDLRGRVVVAAAFQMLCPGCVAHTIPQLVKAHEYFAGKGVAIIGLHTVFEHHSAMGMDGLRAFVSEYRLSFPVGVDRHESGQAIPVTMRTYGLQGTPTLILVDRHGYLRRQTFGHVPDMQLGAEIMALLAEPEAMMPDMGNAPGDRCEVSSGQCLE